jgi:chloramphenicol-sensitive protein RarD
VAATYPEARRGTVYGVGAYLLWGVLPLYFTVLDPAGPIEILLQRVVWSVIVCALVLSVVRGWREFVAVMHSPVQLGWLAAAAAFISVNWGVYIYGVTADRVVETSLGYFINPLVTVLFGVLLLRERLRPVQWVAVGTGAVAVVVLTLDYGRLPWIALVLAFSFAIYGFVKNRVGQGVGALTSLSVETALLTPFALAGLVVIEATGGGTFTEQAPWHPLLLAASGVITAVPLILFAAAARRVPLTTIGLLQYLAPVLQFGIGVLVLNEKMPPSRWFGFALVWLALVILTLDSVRNVRSRGRLARAAEACAT